MKKLILASVLCVLTSVSFADSIRLSDGTSCTSDSDDSNFEMSFGVEQDNGSYDYDYGYNGSRNKDRRVQLELTYKFNTPSRLDCDVLYQMELESRRMELEIKKQKLKLLQSAQEIDW